MFSMKTKLLTVILMLGIAIASFALCYVLFVAPPVSASSEYYVQYEPITYREWQSVEEFEDMFKGSAHPLTSTACLATAKNIKEYALSQGYPVSIALTQHGVYYDYVVSSNVGNHAGLLVDIQGVWYFVDVYPWRMTRLFSDNLKH